MDKVEEQEAANAIGGLITSVMMHAHDGAIRRNTLYAWERDALRWLVRYFERNAQGSAGNDWVKTFVFANREMILSERGPINFDLKSFMAAEKKRKERDGSE